MWQAIIICISISLRPEFRLVADVCVVVCMCVVDVDESESGFKCNCTWNTQCNINVNYCYKKNGRCAALIGFQIRYQNQTPLQHVGTWRHWLNENMIMLWHARTMHFHIWWNGLLKRPQQKARKAHTHTHTRRYHRHNYLWQTETSAHFCHTLIRILAAAVAVIVLQNPVVANTTLLRLEKAIKFNKDRTYTFFK